MSLVRSATSAAHRVPSHAGPSPRAAGAPLQSSAGVLDSQHWHRPKGLLAQTPHSSHRVASPADSRRVHFAILVLLYHRPCHMIAESGTSGWV